LKQSSFLTGSGKRPVCRWARCRLYIRNDRACEHTQFFFVCACEFVARLRVHDTKCSDCKPLAPAIDAQRMARIETHVRYDSAVNKTFI
jgi:hypothetical protein